MHPGICLPSVCAGVLAASAAQQAPPDLAAEPIQRVEFAQDGAGFIASNSSPRLVFQGQVEQFQWAVPNGDKLENDQRAVWMTGTLGLSETSRVVAGHFRFATTDMLDENYLEFDSGSTSVRIGRIRPAFGFADWSENYYSGFIYMPMARFMPLSPTGLRLLRMDAGADIRGGTDKLQYQIGLVDVGSERYQLLPTGLMHLVARVQGYQNGHIVGLNGLYRPKESGKEGVQVLGLDWRWTSPQFQFRGEAVKGRVGSYDSNGYYLDLFFKPFGWTQTTLLARTQGVSRVPWSPAESQLHTLGVKHVLSPALTIEANYGFGPGGPLEGTARGWSFQVRSTLYIGPMYR